MKMMKLAVLLVFTCCLTQQVHAGPLDIYYLQQFREIAQDPSATTTPQRPKCGMPLKLELKRDWNKLEAATQSILAKRLNAPVLSNGTTMTSTGGHFVIHYATSGVDVPTPRSPYTVTTWVRQVADTFEQVYSAYKNTYGYTPAPGNQYHVYLLSLAQQGVYGVTTTTALAASANYPYAAASYIEIDKDFTDPNFTGYPVEIYTPLQNLQITAAHEYQHSIQFGYNYASQAWYAEATATWFESMLFPNILQNYEYVYPYFKNSMKHLDLAVNANAMTTGAGYGRWIFNRYMVENYSPTLVRTVWENMIHIVPPTDNTDIPMIPVISSTVRDTGGNLSTVFAGFAKRVYMQQDWQIAEDRDNMFLQYVPVSTYSRYPVNYSSNPRAMTYLERLSFVYHKFVPNTSYPNNTMSITVNATPGIKATVFRKEISTQQITEIDVPSTYPTTVYVSNVGTAYEIVLLLVNTSETTTENANFSTDGSFVQTAPVTTTDIPANPVSESFAKGAGGGGCFVATAAFGSYLHPQVQILRDFRDSFLLNTAPGRLFVKLYYRLSPPAADFIAKHDTLRLCVRLMLTPIIFAIANTLIILLVIGTAILGWLIRTMCLRTLNMQVQPGKQ